MWESSESLIHRAQYGFLNSMTEACGAAYVGREVLKNFPEHGDFRGRVHKYYGPWKSHPFLVDHLQYSLRA